MKKILITGAGSYIGTSFEEYMKQWPDKYQVDTVDMIGDDWMKYDFSGYDTVYHVAGIAHSDNGKISKEKAKLYYDVNTKLTIKTAMKAKKSGVKQFIFMSSAIVYGDSAPIGKMKMITKDTPVNPANCYGDSKVKAERGLKKLEDENFKVVILRPPMIYGKGSKGNYPLMSKLAQKMPVFPYVKNCRSMLYIENLMEFVRLMIENEEQGIFWPQNAEYSNTSELVRMISKAHGKKVYLIHGFELSLKILGAFTGLVDKAFGNLCYDKRISAYKHNYRVVSLKDSIKIAEKDSYKNALILTSVASMIEQFNMTNIRLEKGIFKSLLAYTSFIALNTVIDQINWNIDKLLLGRFKGTAEVAIYSVGYTLYGCYMMFSTSISGVFTPRIHKIVNSTTNNSSEQRAQLTELFTRVGRLQFMILALIASGIVFFGKFFITSIWAGKGYDDSYYVALLLVIPASIALIQNMGIEIQRAENKHQFRSIAYAVMALVNLGSSIILCQKFGAIGSAIGTAISLVLANGVVMNFYYNRHCNIDIPFFWKNILRQSVGLIIPLCVGTSIVLLIPIRSILIFSACIITYTATYCISMWIFGMNDYEKDLVTKPLKRLLRRN